MATLELLSGSKHGARGLPARSNKTDLRISIQRSNSKPYYQHTSALLICFLPENKLETPVKVVGKSKDLVRSLSSKKWDGEEARGSRFFYSAGLKKKAGLA
jgi:hypothetical protein